MYLDLKQTAVCIIHFAMAPSYKLLFLDFEDNGSTNDGGVKVAAVAGTAITPLSQSKYKQHDASAGLLVFSYRHILTLYVYCLHIMAFGLSVAVCIIIITICYK